MFRRDSLIAFGLAVCGGLVLFGALPSCASDVRELEEENRLIRAEMLSIREELRELREDTRELREQLAMRPTQPAPAPAPLPPVTTTPPVENPAPAPVGSAPNQANIKISINSNPRGATVFVSDKIVGKTPLLFQRPPGTEQLMLRIDKPGYQPRLMSLRPDEDAKISVQLAKQ